MLTAPDEVRAVAPATARSHGALVSTAARLGGVAVAEVSTLASALLDRDMATTPLTPQTSALTSDGDPLQVCVSVAPGRTVVRLIGDPATDEADPVARRIRARRAVERHVTAAGLPVAPVRRMLAMLLPDRATQSWDPGVGECWLAAPVRGPGFAVYANGAWGPPATVWPRVLRWLEQELPGNDGIHALLRSDRGADVLPAAVGLEVDGQGRRRVKVYVRLARSAPLSALGPAPLLRPEVATFLRAVLGPRPLPRTGLVIALGLVPGSSGVDEVKLDVCACERCRPSLRTPWPELLDGLGHRLALPFDWSEVLVDGTRPAFVGMGIGTVGAPRLNLYLQAA